MLVCENMVGYPPCTSFQEELLDFRDPVFCDLDTTDVCLFKNRNHGEEHVKKLFSTAVIVNEDTHWTFVRGH